MPCLYNLRAVTRKLLCTQLSAPTLANPPALCASPFAKGGIQGGISATVYASAYLPMPLCCLVHSREVRYEDGR